MLDTKNYKIPKIYSYLILSILIVSLLWLLIRLNNSIPYETLGYLGIYISSLISASSIFIPIPGIGAVCVGSLPSLGLNPLLIGLIAGLAESIGELTGYFTGRSFSGSFKETRLKDYLFKKMKKNGSIIIFFGSIFPNPFFDIIGIISGNIKYPIRKFIVVLFFSKSIKSLIISYSCYSGLEIVIGWFR